MEPIENPDNVVNPAAGINGLKVIFRAGGVAAMILVVYSLVTMVLLLTVGGPFKTVEECFAVLHENRVAGLIRLDLLTIIIIPFYYLVFLGICLSLWKSHSGYVFITGVLAFAGITLVLTTPSVFSLVTLSDKFSLAVTETERSRLLAAGEAILAADMWHSTGTWMGGILMQTSAVLLSVIMLRSNVFNKTTAFSGIVTHGLDLAHILVGVFSPGAGVVLMAIAGPLYLVWFPLVGWRLLQIGRNGAVTG